MSIKLEHRDYCGWFPFDLPKDANLIIAPGYSAMNPRNVWLPLPSLVKAYWLTKSFDYTINLAFSSSFNPGFGTITEAGTFTGTGTVVLSAPVPPARAFNQDNTLSPFTVPVNDSLDAHGIVYDLNMTSGTSSFTGHGPGVYFDWFDTFFNEGFPQAVVSVDAADHYLSYAQLDVGFPFPNTIGGIVNFGGLDAGRFDSRPLSATRTLSAATATIKVDGVSSSPIPLFAGWYASAGTVTGSVLFDFNSFY